MRRTLFALLAMVLFIGCFSPVKMLKPYGDQARIRLISGTQFSGELLAVNDTALYFLAGKSDTGLTPNAVVRLSIPEVDRVHVNDYSLQSRIGLAMVAAVALDGLTIYAFRSGSLGWPLYVFAAAVPVAVAAYFWGNPKVDFKPPRGPAERAGLKSYCRYPQGLTGAQWQVLLQDQHQSDFLTPPGPHRP